MNKKYEMHEDEAATKLIMDDGIEFNGIDAIRLQGINVLWSTQNPSILAKLVRFMKDKAQELTDEQRQNPDITRDEYLELFSAEESIKHLLDVQKQYEAGVTEGLTQDEFVSQMKNKFPWLTV